MSLSLEVHSRMTGHELTIESAEGDTITAWSGTCDSIGIDALKNLHVILKHYHLQLECQ